MDKTGHVNESIKMGEQKEVAIKKTKLEKHKV